MSSQRGSKSSGRRTPSTGTRSRRQSGCSTPGEVRVAEQRDGRWVVNEWAKKAILLYFRLRKVEPTGAGPFGSWTRSR